VQHGSVERPAYVTSMSTGRPLANDTRMAANHGVAATHTMPASGNSSIATRSSSPGSSAGSSGGHSMAPASPGGSFGGAGGHMGGGPSGGAASSGGHH
jgi:hypothetical protein